MMVLWSAQLPHDWKVLGSTQFFSNFSHPRAQEQLNVEKTVYVQLAPHGLNMHCVGTNINW